MQPNGSPGGAIVCPHVAEGGEAILFAERSAPVNEEDSGWQFLCRPGKHDDERRAQVWALDEVVERDPTLAVFINEPIGTRLSRKSPTAAWEKSVVH